MTDSRVAAFLRTVLQPAFTEIAASPRMLRDFAIYLYDDAIDDPLHATLVSELAGGSGDRRTIGPVLLAEERDPRRRPLPFGGRYLVTVWLREKGDVIVASPLVLFQMQFDRRLHAFDHRYGASAEVPVEKVTRVMILNHVLSSFTFFRMHALSSTRPW